MDLQSKHATTCVIPATILVLSGSRLAEHAEV